MTLPISQWPPWLGELRRVDIPRIRPKLKKGHCLSMNTWLHWFLHGPVKPKKSPVQPSNIGWFLVLFGTFQSILVLSGNWIKVSQIGSDMPSALGLVYCTFHAYTVESRSTANKGVEGGINSPNWGVPCGRSSPIQIAAKTGWGKPKMKTDKTIIKMRTCKRIRYKNAKDITDPE